MLLTLHCGPTSQTCNKAGQAALKGREQKLKNEYKHWQVIGCNNIHVTNNFAGYSKQYSCYKQDRRIAPASNRVRTGFINRQNAGVE